MFVATTINAKTIAAKKPQAERIGHEQRPANMREFIGNWKGHTIV